MSDQPTGEWTAKTVDGYWTEDGTRTSFYKTVADAHNAALAAEREKLVARDAFAKRVEKQLAAEREKVQTYEGALIKIANDPNCDRCQVAVNALAKEAK